MPRKMKEITAMLKRFFLLAAILLVLPAAAGAVEQGYTVFHGDRGVPSVAVTVDDCYNADHVAEILDICEAEEVPVTFFVIGAALKDEDRAVWQRAIDLGCEIGNHTHNHARLSDLNDSRIRRQLTRAAERFNEVLGWDYTMQVMRPPYGRLSKDPKKKSDMRVVEAIESAGYRHAVRWDISQTDPDKAIKAVQNGSIMLYHANPKDVRCLKKLLPALKEAGYTCVTVSELLGLTADETAVETEVPPAAWAVDDAP